MTEQEQVNALWELQGSGDDLEEELAEAYLTRVERYQGGGLHTSDVYEVVLETGRKAYFKPVNGLQSSVGQRALKNYDHTPVSVSFRSAGHGNLRSDSASRGRRWWRRRRCALRLFLTGPATLAR